MEERIENIILDRTFDASCFKMLLNDNEMAQKIIDRLIQANPFQVTYIRKMYNFYCRVCDSNIRFFKMRAEYLNDHRDNLKLRFK